MDLTSPIEDLLLATRTRNALRQGGIETVGDLLESDEERLFSIDGFGVSSLDDVLTRLAQAGLR